MDDNTLVKVDPVLRMYEESAYIWILHMRSHMWPNFPGDKKVCSPEFHEKDDKWKGLLNIKFFQGYIIVFLNLYGDMTTFRKYKIHILNCKDEIVCKKSGKGTIPQKLSGKGFKYSDSLRVTDDVFLNDGNIFKIKLIIIEDVIKTPQPCCESISLMRDNADRNLKSDLKTLFENEEFCDFVIKLDDSSEIPVHKNILAVRSSVFSAMFQNDSSEKNEGYVKITDIEKDTMILLLNFIYTGNMTFDLSAEKARKLFTAADKYDIGDLKQFCGKYLENNLEISNAIDTLLLAELYNISELKTCVFEFILNNRGEYLDPIIFEKVEKRFPNLLTELMITILKETVTHKDKEKGKVTETDTKKSTESNRTTSMETDIAANSGIEITTEVNTEKSSGVNIVTFLETGTNDDEENISSENEWLFYKNFKCLYLVNG